MIRPAEKAKRVNIAVLCPHRACLVLPQGENVAHQRSKQRHTKGTDDYGHRDGVPKVYAVFCRGLRLSIGCMKSDRLRDPDFALWHALHEREAKRLLDVRSARIQAE